MRTLRQGRRARLLAAAVLALSGAGAAAQDPRSGDGSGSADQRARATIESGRELTQRFYAGELAPLWHSMTDALRDALGGRDELTAFRARVLDELGTEQQLLEERQSEQGGIDVYRRLARFSNDRRPVSITFSLDERGKIAGFRVEPALVAAPSPHLDYRTRARLSLPFSGAWHVFWGGRTLAQNYHAASREQRFAYDFVVRRSGTTHAGSGGRNEDYYCWQRPVLAPAGAQVVAAVDRHPDQPPGSSDPEHPAGNHVVLDLGNREFAVLAHLRAGSVTVEVGVRVAAGEPIGRCGNSGNTSEPHLHFHLQDEPAVGSGHGLPAYFHDYYADGTAVDRGEPVRCQTVSNAAPRTGAPRDSARGSRGARR
jgi:murein DD-endopeptidase MepM/ murein hydrolase activator NlpD